jgi:polyisoprenoid-binding protein YceI
VRWSAKKPLIESYVDRGIIPVESGEITVTADNLSTGSITFDVANIEATKTANARLGVERLTDHLRSEDFLAVEEFPTTKFTLTAAEAIASTTDETDYELTGNLTLKGETNEISFPANVGMSELGALVVEENTEIDRSRWNIRYGSESFFDDLGDNLIANEVEIEIDLVARLEN